MKSLDKYNIERFKDRYRVVDIETGEIIDDAQGYGFKTIQGAYKCLYYKINKSEIDKLNISYRNIINKYKYLETIQNDISNEIFYSIKNGNNLTKKEINSYILSEIEKHIPELLIEINEDDNFKKHFLKEINKN